MAHDVYKEALKLGQKMHREAIAKGGYPYLPALDDMISRDDYEAEISLGLVEIPIDQISGTKTAGRTTAFASNFMPLLASNSEFASKWITLYDSLCEEGLRDSIKAYEYMNRFYVLEGNKRVSVMKYLGSSSIPGEVIRLVPRQNGTLMNQVYYEFMAFYRNAKINYLSFSKLGSYVRLQSLVGKNQNELWSDDELKTFHSFYIRFSNAFRGKAGSSLKITPADAMLIFLEVYPYEKAIGFLPAEVKERINKCWDEIKAADQPEPVALSMAPAEKKPNVISKLLSSDKEGAKGSSDETDITKLFTPEIVIDSEKKLQKIAFIYDKYAKDSSWVYGHELGRRYLEQHNQGLYKTMCFENVDTSDPKIVYGVIEEAIRQGCSVIFTTTPRLLKGSLQASVDYPGVKILNCSINKPHPSVRTYYGRMYEAKFLLGAIAGAMSENDHIGYIADYPIQGMNANINAFALGAQMTNPRAVIDLEWSSVNEEYARQMLKNKGICFISDRDMIIPNMASREFGLYARQHEGDREIHPDNLATPVWQWGHFYDLIMKSIRSGSWKNEASQANLKAVNYWWGMSSGVIDLICSKKMPEGTRRMVEMLRQGIRTGSFHPFAGRIVDQQGEIRHDSEDAMSPEEIITMDWLAANVIGSIPTVDELNTISAKEVVEAQGLNA